MRSRRPDATRLVSVHSMSEPTRPDQAERLARVAARRRRRSPATAAKIVSTGLATTGLVGGVGLIASHAAPPAKPRPRPPVGATALPSTIATIAITTTTIHQTVLVDEFGNAPT